MKKITCLVATGLIILGACSTKNDDNSPTIAFKQDGNEVMVLSRNEMQNSLTSFSISYYDTVYEKNKNLKAFLLKDVLEQGFSINLENSANYTFVFTASDRFETSTDAGILNESGGYLAFEDLDVEGIENWEPVATENNNDPAPFYIVWTEMNQVPENGYPWPYQLSSIILMSNRTGSF